MDEKSKNLESIALTASGLAALAGCREEIPNTGVTTPETRGFDGTKALYDTAAITGIVAITVFAGYKILKRYNII